MPTVDATANMECKNSNELLTLVSDDLALKFTARDIDGYSYQGTLKYDKETDLTGHQLAWTGTDDGKLILKFTNDDDVQVAQFNGKVNLSNDLNPGEWSGHWGKV